MGQNLTGIEARIWGLHLEGFAASGISGLVGMAEDYVRGVIVGVWLDDKMAGGGKRRRKC